MPSWQIGEVRAALEKAEQSTEEEPSIVRNIPYVSVWDGGNCIAATKADVCLDTKQVFNIQTIDVGDSANVLTMSTSCCTEQSIPFSRRAKRKTAHTGVTDKKKKENENYD